MPGDVKDMTKDQHVDVLALGMMIERVAAYPGGARVIGELLSGGLKRSDLVLIAKGELADLRARATGTTLTTEGK